MGWRLTDLESVPKNGLKVFSAFSCGGGSCMGYKLAGYDVVGYCEFDPKMAEMYDKNFNTRHRFVMDMRDFKWLQNYPDDLMNLDILDGSPPCSVFSIAGKREDDWRRQRRFTEGTMEQSLDDLFFHFIEAAARLKPKVVICENVTGLLIGNARGYARWIVDRFMEAGYEVQMFGLNASTMGVPQARERIFIICRRSDLGFPKLEMRFNEPPILFKDVRSEHGKPVSRYRAEVLKKKMRTDRDVSDILRRVYGQQKEFNSSIFWDDEVGRTIVSGGSLFRAYDDSYLSDADFIACQTFPEDFYFNGNPVQYVCGMSVPPVMMKRIAEEIYKQWFGGVS